MIRKQKLINSSLYHIFNKSISKYTIFNSDFEFNRFINIINYYLYKNPPVKYSRFLEYSTEYQQKTKNSFVEENKLVEIIAYCLMPTHFHLILKQLKKSGVSILLGNIENSYARYFNLAHRRSGPLWVGPFKNISINTNEQLLHLTRYIHLNPCSSNIVKYPHEWKFSSFREFIHNNAKDKMCNYFKYFDLSRNEYKTFVEEFIDQQKELELIKHLILE